MKIIMKNIELLCRIQFEDHRIVFDRDLIQFDFVLLYLVRTRRTDQLYSERIFEDLHLVHVRDELFARNIQTDGE